MNFVIDGVYQLIPIKKDKIVICQTHLECVNQLGVNVSSSGKFITAEKTLSLKASRALFSKYMNI